MVTLEKTDAEWRKPTATHTTAVDVGNCLYLTSGPQTIMKTGELKKQATTPKLMWK